jgi:hypothetical protein
MLLLRSKRAQPTLPGRLAVDKTYQGRGIDELLPLNALKEATMP